MSHPVLIAPSLLSADFARLADEIATVASADTLHVDVMDGHFVPNLTIGAPVAAALHKVSPLPLDCHLMVTRPDDLLDDFARAGTKALSVHVEVAWHLHRTLQRIRDLGMQPGVAFNPHTPVTALEAILPFCDFVLAMSVNPGFGGQKFIPEVLAKVRQLDHWRREHKPDLRIQIDGGITPATIRAARQAGADWFVAGSAVFGQTDRSGAIAALRAAAGQDGLTPARAGV